MTMMGDVSYNTSHKRRSNGWAWFFMLILSICLSTYGVWHFVNNFKLKTDADTQAVVLELPADPDAKEWKLNNTRYKMVTHPNGLECLEVKPLYHYGQSGSSCNWGKFNKENPDG